MLISKPEEADKAATNQADDIRCSEKIHKSKQYAEMASERRHKKASASHGPRGEEAINAKRESKPIGGTPPAL